MIILKSFIGVQGTPIRLDNPKLINNDRVVNEFPCIVKLGPVVDKHNAEDSSRYRTEVFMYVCEWCFSVVVFWQIHFHYLKRCPFRYVNCVSSRTDNTCVIAFVKTKEIADNGEAQQWPNERQPWCISNTYCTVLFIKQIQTKRSKPGAN